MGHGSRRARALLALAVGVGAGCVGQQQIARHVGAGAQLDGASLQGAELAASGEIHGVGLSIRAHGERVEREEPEQPGAVRRRIGVGADLGLRLSLFGILADEHRLERWLDVGVDAAAGGGLVKPAQLESYGRAWIGGWAVIGLFPGNPYASLVLDVRRIANRSWDDATVFTVGVAYSSRRVDNIQIRD